MDLQHVYTARDSMDANFLKGLLQQEGIEAVVQGEPLTSAWSTLPLSAESLPSVWVKPADLERAAAVVEQYRQTDRANAESTVEDGPRAVWECPNCGEDVEEQFTACWKCGHARPAEGGAKAYEA